MASVNKVILVGNLGRDPEMRYSPNGGAICNITVATSRVRKDRDTGERREDTEWHRVVLFDRLGEIANEYLRKGRSVYIEGRLQTRKWQDKEGQDRWTTEIIAEQMQMLGGRDSGGEVGGGGGGGYGARGGAPAGGSGGGGARGSAGGGKPAPDFEDIDDDIPF